MNEDRIINENEFHDTIKNESNKMQTRKCSDISPLGQIDIDATKMLSQPIMDSSSSAYLIDSTCEAKA